MGIFTTEQVKERFLKIASNLDTMEIFMQDAQQKAMTKDKFEVEMGAGAFTAVAHSYIEFLTGKEIEPVAAEHILIIEMASAMIEKIYEIMVDELTAAADHSKAN